jgi:RNA polymerase sigma-70 factor (ECF subfamily)
MTESEGYLLQCMSAGDEEAFRILYQRCQGAIYRFALHMSGSAAIAEDVTQEVFMTLIRSKSRFDPSRGTLSAYLLGIGRNLLFQRFEKERVFVPFPAGKTHDGRERQNNGHHASLVVPPQDPVRDETIGRVRHAVLTLPVNYREVVVLCDLQEATYEEAARVLHCAIGTVRSRLHRARLLLTEKLRDVHQPGRRVAADFKAKSARNRS